MCSLERAFEKLKGWHGLVVAKHINMKKVHSTKFQAGLDTFIDNKMGFEDAQPFGYCFVQSARALHGKPSLEHAAERGKLRLQ